MCFMSNIRYSFAGMLLTNSVPHFVIGLTSDVTIRLAYFLPMAVNIVDASVVGVRVNSCNKRTDANPAVLCRSIICA